MEEHDARARLLVVTSLLDGRRRAAHKEAALLHEAMELCAELGLDEEWRIYKDRLELLQQTRLRALVDRKRKRGERDS